jgi:hypothetical protein
MLFHLVYSLLKLSETHQALYKSLDALNDTPEAEARAKACI